MMAQPLTDSEASDVPLDDESNDIAVPLVVAAKKQQFSSVMSIPKANEPFDDDIPVPKLPDTDTTKDGAKSAVVGAVLAVHRRLNEVVWGSKRLVGIDTGILTLMTCGLSSVLLTLDGRYGDMAGVVVVAVATLVVVAKLTGDERHQRKALCGPNQPILALHSLAHFQSTHAEAAACRVQLEGGQYLRHRKSFSAAVMAAILGGGLAATAVVTVVSAVTRLVDGASSVPLAISLVLTGLATGIQAALVGHSSQRHRPFACHDAWFVKVLLERNSGCFSLCEGKLFSLFYVCFM